MKRSTHVLYCDCSHADVIPPRVKREVLRKLNGAAVTFSAVADLCGLAARKDPALKKIVESGDVRIAACYPRAVRWLFHAAGAPLVGRRVEVLNMREQSATEIVAGLLSGLPVARDKQIREEFATPEPGAWLPWFPVIDYDRCTGCKQCLSFCLFGVYAVDGDDRVEVRNPERCKTWCPACARVCPSVAIMFPKYDKRPINGDEVREEDVQREAVKIDVSALLRGDIHSALRARSKRKGKRSSPPTGLPVMAPRNVQDLKDMQTELDIPDSVMQTLSSACACDCDCRSETACAAENRCECSGGCEAEERRPDSTEDARDS